MSDPKTATDKLVIDNSYLTDNRTARDKEEDQALDQLMHSKKNKIGQIKVNVLSPFNIYYNDIAYSLSATNLTGKFDILPGHHNFICILVPCTVAIRTTSNQIQNIDINGGLLHVKDDYVQLFLDI